MYEHVWCVYPYVYINFLFDCGRTMYFSSHRRLIIEALAASSSLPLIHAGMDGST